MEDIDNLLELYLDDDEIGDGDRNSRIHEVEAVRTYGAEDSRKHGVEGHGAADALRAYHAYAYRVPGACGQRMDLGQSPVAYHLPRRLLRPSQLDSCRYVCLPRARSIVFLPSTMPTMRKSVRYVSYERRRCTCTTFH